MENFIERLATEIAEGRSIATAEREGAYLRWLRLVQGEGEVGTGGLLLVANADGTLHYAQLLDLLELRLEHGL
ncbi:hypothetical protein CS8_015770 [Cupriavidus sp. 8B]